MITSNKNIHNIDELKKKIETLKKQNLKIVHCHGVFDILHAGHISYFESAKKHGDILIVTITDDKYVNKGPGRPFFKSAQRLDVLSAIKIIDFVYINKDEDAIELIKIIKPHFYVKGPDYKNLNNDVTRKIKHEKKITEKFAGKVVFTNDETFSSSNVLNKSHFVFNDSQKKFINKIIKKKIEDVYLIKFLDKIKKNKILLIGESIIDNYNFCEGMGKSGKESVLVVRDLFENFFLGGALAAANQLSLYCKEVNLITYVGEKKEYLNFIKKKLNKNIKLHLIYKKNSNTIVKKRFYDLRDRKKLFGCYTLQDSPLQIFEENRFINLVKKQSKINNIMLVLDFGHGLISGKAAKFISKNKIFYGLNAQVNSSTVGYSNISKYKKPKCLVINATELRQELRDRDGDLILLAKKFKKKIKSDFLIVTMGRLGVILLDKKNNLINCPAFASDIVDKIGAGDTLFSFLNLFLSSGCDIEISLFIASIAAANSTGEYANSHKFDKTKLLKSFNYLLK